MYSTIVFTAVYIVWNPYSPVIRPESMYLRDTLINYLSKYGWKGLLLPINNIFHVAS